MDQPIAPGLPLEELEELEEPEPEADCDVCTALSKQRAEADARGDQSAVTDCNAEIRNHHRRHRRRK
ncbi:hypothetical protein U9R90_24870 [Streptomyces sp. E11-3]|uniref:hypothetical protein n=1 Tax=Streptomyces sp. E11-3 TaxID=3110112 RepID=UPI003980C663